MKMRIKYDKATKAWLNSHICKQTTVCWCGKCGLFYKPSLGHKCKAKVAMKNETDRCNRP